MYVCVCVRVREQACSEGTRAERTYVNVCTSMPACDVYTSSAQMRNMVGSKYPQEKAMWWFAKNVLKRPCLSVRPALLLYTHARTHAHTPAHARALQN